MTDVVEIAKERIATLAAEIGTLDGFIRMAEMLAKDNRLESNKVSDTLRKYHATATFLVGLTPLIRPEGAIVMVTWVRAYLGMGRWRVLPWILGRGGGGFAAPG